MSYCCISTAMQYAYNKHLNVRGGPEEPLLGPEPVAEAETGQQQPQRQQLSRQQAAQYHFLASKLWWAGIALLLLALGLISITLYSLLAPPV